MNKCEEGKKMGMDVEITASGVDADRQHNRDRTACTAGGRGRTPGTAGDRARAADAAGGSGRTKRVSGCETNGLVLRCGRLCPEEWYIRRNGRGRLLA